MASTSVAQRLAKLEQRHRELASQIAHVGIAAAGSVTRRYALHLNGTPLQRWSTNPARALLAVDRKSQRRDGHSQVQRPRG